MYSEIQLVLVSGYTTALKFIHLCPQTDFTKFIVALSAFLQFILVLNTGLTALLNFNLEQT